jgi:YnbE-like lipoprotein
MKAIVTSVLAVAVLAGCAPTVKVQAPDKPIEINLNVNIEHKIKVEIDRDVQQAIKQNKDIF